MGALDVRVTSNYFSPEWCRELQKVEKHWSRFRLYLSASLNVDRKLNLIKSSLSKLLLCYNELFDQIDPLLAEP